MTEYEPRLTWREFALGIAIGAFALALEAGLWIAAILVIRAMV